MQFLVPATIVDCLARVFIDSRRYRLHQTPNGKRETLYVPVFSDQRPRYLMD
jgi:hypothetical protein